MRIDVAHAVTPQGVIEDARIVVDGDRITAVEPGGVAAGGMWAVPGFVDTHCHGAVGTNFGDPSREANLRAVEHHRRHGTTTLFASTVTESIDELESRLAVLKGLVDDGELAGIHLEGPFLAEARKGAHDASLLRDPEPGLVERLITAGGPALRMITLAVERDGAEEATRGFREAGVAVAFGHSDAGEITTALSIDWGVTVATHLFSAMRPLHHRVPGPVPVLLADPRVMVELICDGVHMSPIVAAMAIDAATAHRVALVTDAMSACGQGDGRYRLGSLEVDVVDGTARLATDDGAPGPIAGSTLTMAQAFEFVVRETGASIPNAALMAATTPARWHGLDEVGQLSPGRYADLCLVDDGGALQAVMRRGQWVVGPRDPAA